MSISLYLPGVLQGLPFLAIPHSCTDRQVWIKISPSHHVSEIGNVKKASCPGIFQKFSPYHIERLPITGIRSPTEGPLLPRPRKDISRKTNCHRTRGYNDCFCSRTVVSWLRVLPFTPLHCRERAFWVSHFLFDASLEKVCYQEGQLLTEVSPGVSRQSPRLGDTR